MNLEELIQPESVLCNVSARSKKHCLEILSELLTRSNPDIANEEVFAALIDREKLGCTCLEKGVAFPHCRVNGLHKSVGALMRLAEPVDFDSTNGQSVDLVFGLMVPEQVDEGCLADVNAVAELLCDDALCARLRSASSSRELWDALMSSHVEAPAKLKRAQQG